MFLGHAPLVAAQPSDAAQSKGDEARSRGDEAEPVVVQLDVAVTLGQDDVKTRDALAAAIHDSLLAEGVEVHDDAELGLYVDVRWTRASAADYSVEFFVRSDRPDARLVHEFVCAGCPALELLRRARAESIEFVAPAVKAEHSALGERAEAISPPPPVAPSPSVADRRYNERLFLAGAIVVIPGAGLTIGAITPMIVKASIDEPIGALEWSLLGAGLGLTVASATLMGVAMARDSHARKPHARVLPTPRGLTVVGRF